MNPILIGLVIIIIAILLVAAPSMPSSWQTSDIPKFFYLGVALIAGALAYFALRGKS
jgi:hypothetical protein